MRNPKYQFFTLEEYKGRLDALRRRMEERGIDMLLVEFAGEPVLRVGVPDARVLLVPDVDSAA